MTTKSANTSEEGAVYGSAEIAEQWKQRKAQRNRATAKVDEMTGLICVAVIEFSMWRPVRENRLSSQLDVSDQVGMF